MRLLSRNFASLLLSAALTTPVFMAGCAVHARVYDPYYHDYHPWGGEVVYYQNWEHDTHRDHVEFNKRSSADQKEYWDWRHSHGDHH
jgi:hypothetical protein